MTARDDRGYRVGADIGGTFTDIIAIDRDGMCTARKVPSTVVDYGRGVAEGIHHLLAQLGAGGEAIADVIHGTTVATNAILERKGARTALLTTEGFRDVLELRRLRTPQLYDLFFEPPPPMVDRARRFELHERVGARGEIIIPLDDDDVGKIVAQLRSDEIQYVAVSLLHSYANPSHEHQVARIVRNGLEGVHLSLSAEILPEIREYERTSTTVVNAYVAPIIEAYLRTLVTRLRAGGIGAPLRVMQSHGGIMSARATLKRAASVVESGPAAGVIAGFALGRQLGLRNLITFDMGGTTAKASLIEEGEISRTTEYEVGSSISRASPLIRGGGYALKLPVIDIAEVGAGGGSIVWVDRGGALKVGPRSAGASPGPACYGTGGSDATVTDANVVLGYCNPGQLAGGAVALQAPLARAALQENIARPLGIGLLQAAYGAHTIANVTMIRAIKAVSTYRGRDPRDFALLAFGGSGPIHAAEIARALHIRRVIVPPMPGLFSARGLLQAQPEYYFVRTVFERLASLGAGAIDGVYRRLRAEAMETLAAEGYAGEDATFRRFADLRYAGQAYELTIPVEPDRLTGKDLAALAERFGAEHERVYGHRAVGEPIDLVNLRLVARVAGRPAAQIRAARSRAAGASTERAAHFGPRFGTVATPVLARGDLGPTPRCGPLIVEEYDATVVVPPRGKAWLHDSHSIVIEVDEDRDNGDARSEHGTERPRA